MANLGHILDHYLLFLRNIKHIKHTSKSKSIINFKRFLQNTTWLNSAWSRSLNSIDKAEAAPEESPAMGRMVNGGRPFLTLSKAYLHHVIFEEVFVHVSSKPRPYFQHFSDIRSVEAACHEHWWRRGCTAVISFNQQKRGYKTNHAMGIYTRYMGYCIWYMGYMGYDISDVVGYTTKHMMWVCLISVGCPKLWQFCYAKWW